MSVRGTSPVSRRPRTGDRGSIAPLVPLVVLALFILGGLIVDGTRDLNARGEAQAYAEEAARAGATAVDLTQGTLALDPKTAVLRVTAYCRAVEVRQPGLVTTCGPDRTKGFDGITDATTCGGVSAPIVVNTIVRLRIHTSLLGIVGISALTSGGQAKARPYEGTSTDTAC